MATDAERMATLETQIKNMSETLAKIDGKLDAWNQNYMPRKETEEMFRSRDEQIEKLASKESVQNVSSKVADMESEQMSLRRMWPAWIGVVISAISLILTFAAK